MAGPFTEGRWFERRDGVIFRMDDPDHITRMLAEGWHEVIEPSTPATESAPVTDSPPPVVVVDVNAARAAFGLEPRPQRPHVKPIRKVKETKGRV